jgi:hypothetical protein
MTCIKTGARVLLECYDLVVSADLYAVGDCIIVRSNPDAVKEHKDMREFGPPTHIVNLNFPNYHLDGVDSFCRDDIGIFIVPNRAMQEAEFYERQKQGGK